MLILAATNMPWDVDPAIKRPGRLLRQVFVPPPDAEARRGMLELKLQGVPQEGIDFAWLAAQTTHYSGADIDGLIDVAKETALEDALLGERERPFCQADFAFALGDVVPSTLDWLQTARNLIKYGGAEKQYRELEKYLKTSRII